MANFDKELFTANLEVMRKSFPVEYDSMRALGAIITTAQGFKADRSKLETCNAVLKSQRGLFSDFRGNMRLPIIVKMSMADDPKAYHDKLTVAYDVLGSKYIFGSEERLMAALILCDHCDNSQVEVMAQKTIGIYESMKKAHPWLTSQADMAFAVLMANAEGDVTARLADVEACYKKLTKEFVFSKDALQTVSHILSTDNTSAVDKVERFMSFFKGFKDDGFRLTGMYMPILAVLAGSELTVEDALSITRENDEFLKKQKGFNIFGIAGAERRMMAAAITALDNMADDKKAGAVVQSTVLDIVIEIEMMIVMMIIIASTTSTAANS